MKFEIGDCLGQYADIIAQLSDPPVAASAKNTPDSPIGVIVIQASVGAGQLHVHVTNTASSALSIKERLESHAREPEGYEPLVSPPTYLNRGLARFLDHTGFETRPAGRGATHLSGLALVELGKAFFFPTATTYAPSGDYVGMIVGQNLVSSAPGSRTINAGVASVLSGNAGPPVVGMKS